MIREREGRVRRWFALASVDVRFSGAEPSQVVREALDNIGFFRVRGV